MTFWKLTVDPKFDINWISSKIHTNLILYLLISCYNFNYLIKRHTKNINLILLLFVCNCEKICKTYSVFVSIKSNQLVVLVPDLVLTPLYLSSHGRMNCNSFILVSYWTDLLSSASYQCIEYYSHLQSNWIPTIIHVRFIYIFYYFLMQCKH